MCERMLVMASKWMRVVMGGVILLLLFIFTGCYTKVIRDDSVEAKFRRAGGGTYLTTPKKQK